MRPGKLKIGGYVYPVKWVRDIECDEYNIILGTCDKVNHEIEILKHMSDRNASATLLHEILHAVFFDRGLDTLLAEHEEHVVTTLANGLMAVLRENKGLAQFLAAPKDLAGGR